MCVTSGYDSNSKFETIVKCVIIEDFVTSACLCSNVHYRSPLTRWPSSAQLKTHQDCCSGSQMTVTTTDVVLVVVSRKKKKKNKPIIIFSRPI